MGKFPCRPSHLGLTAAIFAIFLSSIFSTFAMFLPMKSLLILASDDVPSFFPEVLTDQGTLGSALILLVAAGIFSGASSLVDRVVEKIFETQGTATVDRESADNFERGAESKATWLLVWTITLFLIFISWVFIALLALWVSTLAGFIWYRIKATGVTPPFTSGYHEFIDRVPFILRQTALWSTVSVAVFTLVVSEPRLGLTGILLATVFGRKLQVGLGRVLRAKSLALVNLQNYGDVRQVSNFALSSKAHPLRYFATLEGLRTLGSFLSKRGLGATDFCIVGAPDKHSVAILAGMQTLQNPVLIRILRPTDKKEGIEELNFRNTLWPVTPYPTSEVSMGEIAGFPIVTVDMQKKGLALDGLVTRPSKFEVFQWLADLERECLESVGFQAQNRFAFSSHWGTPVIDRLNRLSLLPGIYQDRCQDLSRELVALSRELAGGPLVWVPRRELQPSDFCQLEDGGIALITHPGWSIGLLGENWTRAQPLPGSVHTNFPSISFHEWECAQIRALTLVLVPALEQNNLTQVEKSLVLLGDSLKKLDAGKHTDI